MEKGEGRNTPTFYKPIEENYGFSTRGSSSTGTLGCYSSSLEMESLKSTWQTDDETLKETNGKLNCIPTPESEMRRLVKDVNETKIILKDNNEMKKFCEGS